MNNDVQKWQSYNSGAWDRVYLHHDGTKYPHECLVRYINFLKQWEYLSPLNALDIGFGSPANLKMCAEHGYNIYGLEVSQEAIEKASKKFKKWRMPFTGLLFNPPTIPFEDNMFALVYSQQAIYHNIELEKVVAEIMRVLLPGGAFFLNFHKPNHWRHKFSERITPDLVRCAPGYPTEGLRGMVLRYFDSKDKLASLFTGFKHLRVDDYDDGLLGVQHSLWVVTGCKDGSNLRQFDMMEHYGRMAKP